MRPRARVEKVTDVLAEAKRPLLRPDYKKLYIADTGEPKNIRASRWKTRDAEGRQGVGGHEQGLR